MDKIIFLDIDGVLNVIGQGYDKYGQTFHKHFEANLKMIIEKTDAKIVISSTWRISGLVQMQEMWKDRNLPGVVIDITPLDWNYTRVRGEEIQQWLDNHIDTVENYVILDDDNDMLDSQLDNFVYTYGNTNHSDCVDIGYGLTIKCSKKAIKILNKIK